MNPTIIARVEAKALGLKHYFTGRPCPRGHIAARQAGNRGCVECACEVARKRRAENPEAGRKATAKWAAANPEKAREKDRRWAAENPDKAGARCARRRASKRNAEPERIRAARYALKHQPLDAAAKAAIRAIVADHDTAIRQWFDACPEGCEVDHIVALAAGGLHCASNMQHLTKAANASKGARPDPYGPLRAIGIALQPLLRKLTVPSITK